MIKDLPLLAEVTQIEPLTETILRILLTPQHFVPYVAGQYLQMLTPEEALCYSIANAPLGAHQYEIHLRHRPQNKVHQHVLSEMRDNGEIPLFLPLGQCHVGVLDAKKPTLMFAQGTGFAQMKAIIEQWMANGVLPPIQLIWLARTPADWYMQPLLDMWAQHHAHFQYALCATELTDKAIVKQAFKQFKAKQVIFAGAFDKMRQLQHKVLETGAVSEAQCYSDAF